MKVMTTSNAKGNGDLIIINNDLLVKSEWLLRNYKIPAKTILNGINMRNKGRSNYWASIKSRGVYFIYLSTIPKITKKRYLLPYDSIIKDQVFAEEEYGVFQEKAEDTVFRNMLIETCIKKHLNYLSFYHEYSLPAEEKIKLAKSHALLDLLINFEKISTKRKYELYNQYYDKSFSFKASNYTYFSQKLREIKNSNIADALVKKYYGNSNALKVTKLVYHAMMHLYKEPVKLSLAEITRRVNIFLLSKQLNTVSATTVYMTINSNQRLKNILTYKRCGEKWAKDRLYSKLVRDSAHYPGDQYQMDATRLQIPFKGANNKPAWLIMSVLMDVCSRKILSVEFDETETVEMYERLLRRTINNTKFLPLEILADNLSQFQNENTGFFELISNMVSKGVQWRQHRPQNPGDKGHVESFFKKFQNRYCKMLEGFVGEGITSKNKDAHPSQEFITESLKSKNLRTKDHLIDRVLALIANYNNDPQHIETTDRDSPNYIFEDLNKPNVIPIPDMQLPTFIYRKKVLTVRNCSVCIKKNGIPCYYKINDIHAAMSLNNSKVDIRIDDSREIVYCYHSSTGEYLGEAEKVQPFNMAAANQTSRDIRLITESFQRDKEIHQYLQKELFSFDQNSILQESDLVFLNPISYTKDELKNAEDRLINNLYVTAPNDEKGNKTRNKKKQVVKTLSILNQLDSSKNGIGDQINQQLFKNKM